MSKSITQVDYEALKRITKDFHQECEDITQLQHALNQKMNAMQGNWTGNAAEAFFAEMKGRLLPAINRLARALQVSETTLNQIAKAFHDADAETVNYYKGLGEDDIRTSSGKAPGHARIVPPGGVPRQSSGSSDGLPKLPLEPPPPGYSPESWAQIPINIKEMIVKEYYTHYVSSEVGLNLRNDPSTTNEEICRIPEGAAVIVHPGVDPVEAEGYTWYKVSYQDADGEIHTGWVASEYLNDTPILSSGTGSSGGVSGSGSGGGFVQGASTAGGNVWLTDTDYGPHYGVDIHSTSEDHDLYSPYSGTVIAADDCPECYSEENPSGNAQGNTTAAYNYGLGATVVVEYAYDDLTEAQRADLQEKGVSLSEGQSLYLMYGHLDPSSMPDAGTVLDPGDSTATIGNSGNSYGDHAHVEAVVTDSGLRPEDDDNISLFFWDTVADRVEEDGSYGQGNRVDPTPLFEIGE